MKFLNDDWKNAKIDRNMLKIITATYFGVSLAIASVLVYNSGKDALLSYRKYSDGFSNRYTDMDVVKSATSGTTSTFIKVSATPITLPFKLIDRLVSNLISYAIIRFNKI